MKTTFTPDTRRQFAWWAVLCLVGLDYFSSLAYLPSIALEFVAELAPFAGVAVVVVTLLGALPVYFYIAGRSHQGEGALGLLGQRFHGWRGKLFILAMLGFLATDLVLTRSLSVSDASTHLLANPYYRGHADWIASQREAIRAALPAFLAEHLLDFWTEQLIVTVVLSLLAFGLYYYLLRDLTRGFVGMAVGVVAVYLLLNLIVLGSSLLYLRDHANLVADWEQTVRSQIGDYRTETGNALLMVLLLGLLGFPPLAIGLSGFELTMGAAPMVRGGERQPSSLPHASDPAERPAGRIFNTRLLMVTAAVVMCLFVLASTFAVPLLVPLEELKAAGEVQHRSLAYLAHGGRLINGETADRINPLFGDLFGTVYDFSALVILCLAGATATISLRHIVPDLLGRFGMQMEWAARINLISHLFNAMILVVTIAFHASVTAQMWAYAASVVALLFAAALAALLDVRWQWRDSSMRWLAQTPFWIICIAFLAIGGLVVIQQPSGVAIALLFVLVVLVTAMVSRWRRSTELRFEGFDYADGDTQARWERISSLDFQVLVPHDPAGKTLDDKDREIRANHRLGAEVPVIFVEVRLGDPSDFCQRPLMRIVYEDGREIVRVSGCTSIAHVVAAIGLAFREVGRPPEIHFAWSEEPPVAANLNFLLFGQGNVPWLVHSLLRKAEPDERRRPRVVIG